MEQEDVREEKFADDAYAPAYDVLFLFSSHSFILNAAHSARK